jgi:hypothetical protein
MKKPSYRLSLGPSLLYTITRCTPQREGFMQHLRIATVLLFGIVAFGGVETAWADVVYSFTTFDPPGSVVTNANGINDGDGDL